eukprot:9888380-Lingulodinium_polyedra.AAC.1
MNAISAINAIHAMQSVQAAQSMQAVHTCSGPHRFTPIRAPSYTCARDLHGNAFPVPRSYRFDPRTPPPTHAPEARMM